MESLRPNAQRAKFAITFIWIVFVAEVLALGSEVMSYKMLQSMTLGISVSDAEKLANNKREALIGLIHTVFYVGSMITFIQWFRRAYFNLGLLNKNLSTTDGWTAGAWFIPIYSWFRPYQLMKEMFVETNSLLKTRVEGYVPATSAKTVGVWWTFWLAFNILGSVLAQIEQRVVLLEAMKASSLCSIIHSFLTLPLTLLTVRMIKEYALMETELEKIAPLSADVPWHDQVQE